MKNLYWTILCCLLIPVSVYSQVSYLKTYGLADQEIGNYSIRTTDGHLMIGYTQSVGSFNRGLITKIDTLGNLLWSNTIHSNANSILSYGVPLADGGFVLAGRFSVGFNDQNGVVMKIDALGNVVWSKYYGSFGNDMISRMIPAGDDYLVGGFTESSTIGGQRDQLILKISGTDGNIIWSRILGGFSNDWVSNMIENNNGYLIAGNTYSYGSGRHDFTLTQLDKNGQISWSKVYGTSTEEQAWNIVRIDDNRSAISGFYDLDNMRRLFVMVVDNDGNFQWARYYTLSNHELSGRVTLANNGDLLFTGYEPTLSNSSNFFLMRLSADDGNIIQAREYEHDGFDALNHTYQDADGSIYMFGYTDSYGTGERDLMLTKVNTNGDLEDCGVLDISTSVEVNNYEPIINNISPLSSNNYASMSFAISAENIDLTQTSPCVAEMTIEEDPLVGIPNAFTPDSDGENDIFRILATDQNFDIKRFRVFNRWGQLVYEYSFGDIGWDGNFNGTPCVQDNYVYDIMIEYPNSEQSEYQGSVLLIR